MKRIIALALCAVMAAGCLTGCVIENKSEHTPTGNGLYSEDGTVPVETTKPNEEEETPQIVMAYYSELTMNPFTCTDYTNRAIFPLMYQSLFVTDQNYKVSPLLCSSYVVSEDMKNYTFYVDENARFSDGDEVTGEDVTASLLAAMASGYYVGRFSHVKSIANTRDGGVLRLETLIADMTDFVRAKVVENQIVEESEVEATTAKIALAALKYGDLSNQPTKDYNFDLERFAAFEGNTGPYILYSIVRIKSILAKYGAWDHLPIQLPANDYAKDLMLAITKFAPTLENALKSSAPNLICAYIYELAGAVNKFYHETRILGEEDAELKAGYIALIGLAKDILEQSIHLLGFSAPEKM